MSKTLHHIDRPFTAGLPPQQAVTEKAELLSTSYLVLEDDVLFAIGEVASRVETPMVWSLVEDAYADAAFLPEQARQLAAECERLVPAAEPLAAIWLATLAAFAAAVSTRGKHLAAAAD